MDDSFSKSGLTSILLLGGGLLLTMLIILKSTEVLNAIVPFLVNWYPNISLESTTAIVNFSEIFISGLIAVRLFGLFNWAEEVMASTEEKKEMIKKAKESETDDIEGG